MTPSEYTAALHAARHPEQDPDERAAALAKHFGLKGSAVEVLAAALHQQADIARSLGAKEACDACPYGQI